MVSKCPPATYLLYIGILCFRASIMAKKYLTVIRFESSGNSVLRKVRKVPLSIESRISAYLSYIILGQFALGSFGLIISVKRHWNCPANWVIECLVSLRYPKEIIYVWDWLLVLFSHTSSTLCLLTCYSLGSVITADCTLLFRFRRAFFHLSFFLF